MLRKCLVVIMECLFKAGKRKIPGVNPKLLEAKITDFEKNHIVFIIDKV